jgi:CheY-like chemotaxis protein
MDDGPSRRVLVADDHTDSADAFRLMLELNGFTVDHASDAAETVDKLSGDVHYCLVLLDLRMPGNGARVLQDLAVRRHGAVVLVTADIHTVRQNPPPAGVQVVFKPVDPDQIVRLAQSHCGAS